MCKVKCMEYGGYMCELSKDITCCIDCEKLNSCKEEFNVCPSVKFYKDKEDLKNNCIFSSGNKDGAK